MDYWNHVLWSDETKVNVFGSDNVKRVWWQPGEEYKDKCVLPTVEHGGGSVMVWGSMSAAGTRELQFIGGTMNANMYCDILAVSQFRVCILQRTWHLRSSKVSPSERPAMTMSTFRIFPGCVTRCSRPYPYVNIYAAQARKSDKSKSKFVVMSEPQKILIFFLTFQKSGSVGGTSSCYMSVWERTLER